MKFSCSTASLQKGISIVEKAISQRTTLPVLENLYLELSGTELKLRGNDLEIGIETLVHVDSTQNEGSVLVKAKTFSSILSKIQSGSINISVDSSNRMILQANKVDFEILCLSVDDYPVFPSVETGISFSVKVSEIKDLIKHTIFAVSFDETKQFLNGILIKSDSGVLYFVSTDGYRLSLKRHTLVESVSDFSLIAPFKAMNELNKILSGFGDDESVLVTVSDSQVAFSVDRFLLVSRVIKGQFPDYRQVMPKHSDNLFTASRLALLGACDRATIISSVSNNVVRLSFTDTQLVVRANAASMGEFTEEIGVTRVQGSGDVKIAFNVKLVLDGIRGIDSDEVRLEFNQGISPCVVRSANDEDYIYIVMPIRTNDFQDDPTQ
jgi:DNA polymerase-3 subunit beta